MIKIIAVLCSLVSGACHDEVVTTSDMPGVTLQGCLMGTPQLAEYMQNKPGYRLAKWKCQIGDRGNVV